MSINSQKTKFMLVTGNRGRNLVASTTIDFNLNGKDIEHVTDFKFLGVMFRGNVRSRSFINRQIEELCKKLAKRMRLLRHISPYLKTRSTRHILLCDHSAYNALWQYDLDFLQ